MIRIYEKYSRECDYRKTGNRLLANDWKLAELNKMYLSREEMCRYKCVLKTLSELEQEELLVLAIRYYKSDKVRSYGAIVPIPYHKAAEMMGISRSKYMDLESRALRRFGELAVKNWEKDVSNKEFIIE